MARIQRVGIIANHELPGVEATLKRAMAVIRDSGAQVLLDSEMSRRLGEPGESDLKALAKACDLILVFGGDGTFLHAARSLEGCATPLLGINMGSLGFLTVLRVSELDDTLRDILAGRWHREERMMLAAVLWRSGTEQGHYRALNDAVIHVSRGGRLVEFSIAVGNQYLGRYRADGLIVATPTGSTAYSMSAGGPIVHPTMDALVATPICPHALAIRPIVVGGAEEFEVRLGGRSGEAVLSMDGMVNVALMRGDLIRIGRAAETLPVLQPEGFSYYQIVHDKLGWGGPEHEGA